MGASPLTSSLKGLPVEIWTMGATVQWSRAVVQEAARLFEDPRRPEETAGHAVTDVVVGGAVVGTSHVMVDAIELVSEGDGAEGVVVGGEGG